MTATDLLAMGFKYIHSTDTFKHEIIEVRLKGKSVYVVERVKGEHNTYSIVEKGEISFNELESILLQY